MKKEYLLHDWNICVQDFERFAKTVHILTLSNTSNISKQAALVPKIVNILFDQNRCANWNTAVGYLLMYLLATSSLCLEIQKFILWEK
jgi:hypothetical protein